MGRDAGRLPSRGRGGLPRRERDPAVVREPRAAVALATRRGLGEGRGVGRAGAAALPAAGPRRQLLELAELARIPRARRGGLAESARRGGAPPRADGRRERRGGRRRRSGEPALEPGSGRPGGGLGEILAEGRARLAQGVAGAARLLRRPWPWPRCAQAPEVGPAPAPGPPATAPPREGHRAASRGAAGPGGAALQQRPAPRRVSGL